jgi:hypothetical protein
LLLASPDGVPAVFTRTAAAVLAAATLLLSACASPQDTISQQDEKLQSLAESAHLIGETWLAGAVTRTYAVTALEAMLLQVEQQRAVLASDPAILVDGRAATLSQQSEALSRLLAQMRQDVARGDGSTLRGRLASIPLRPDGK